MYTYGRSLSDASVQAWIKMFGQNHSVDITAYLVDVRYEGGTNPAAKRVDISDTLIDGQVTVNTTSEVSRSANLNIFDPTSRLGIDAAKGPAFYLDKMIEIYYQTTLAGYTPYFDPSGTSKVSTTGRVPIFKGPISKVSREGAVLSIECLGKESLLTKGLLSPVTFKKGTQYVAAIQQILRLAGEDIGRVRGLNLTSANGGKVLAADLVIPPASNLWSVIGSLASLLGYQAFYDGQGLLQFRPWMTTPCWTFSDGPDTLLLSAPKNDYDLSGTLNSAYASGAEIPGSTTGAHYVGTSVLPSTNPLSPINLKRGETARYIPGYIEDDAVVSAVDAANRATAYLNQSSTETISTSFDLLPFPLLEESDRLRVTVKGVSTDFNLQQMTIPLTVGSAATIGYLRNVSVGPGAVKRILPPPSLGKRTVR